jgi:outer membrane protein OmpA-like peptidoglycan-associated protein
MKTKHFIINKTFALIVGLMTAAAACARTTEKLPENNLTVNDEYSEDDLPALARYLETSYCPHELSIGTAGGASSLNSRLASGKIRNGFAGALGVGYTFFPNKNWGLSSGLEYAFYQTEIGISGFSGNRETLDIIGNPILYHTQIEHYREKQKTGLLNIPLSVLYQTNGKQQFYASLGIKWGLPVSAKYSGSNAVLTASGYYPEYNQTEIWQNDLGYGVFNLNKSNGKLDLGVSLSGTVETGVKWNTGIGTALYTGVFMDCGFNNLLKHSYSGKRLVEYNRLEPEKPLMNTACVLADKFSPMAFGVKLKLAFSVGCRDLLNDRKAYRAMQSGRENDFYDFPPPAESSTPEINANPADTAESDTVPSSQAGIITTDTMLKIAEAEMPETETSDTPCDSVFPPATPIDRYKVGRVAVTREQEFTLDEYAGLLLENPQAHIEITGHTCDLGTDRVNMRIGLKRAESAKDYLVKKGIEPSRIQTFSEGESKPLFPNGSEENRRKNRRVEIKLNK